MFNLDNHQRRVVRITVVSAGALWICNQIVDSTVVERMLHQLTVLTLCVGALRVWVLEAVKRDA